MRLLVCNAKCERRSVGSLFARAFTYLKPRGGRPKPTFVTPPPDSMGP